VLLLTGNEEGVEEGVEERVVEGVEEGVEEAVRRTRGRSKMDWHLVATQLAHHCGRRRRESDRNACLPALKKITKPQYSNSA